MPATPQQVVYGQGVVIFELVVERDQALLRCAQLEEEVTALRAAAKDESPEAAPRARRRTPEKKT